MKAARESHSAHNEVARPRVTDLLSALLLMLTLPLFTYYVWFCLKDFNGTLQALTAGLFARIPAPTLGSVVLYGCWFFLQIVLQIAAPGEVQEGVPLADGTRLKYKMNGCFCFWFTTGLAVF